MIVITCTSCRWMNVIEANEKFNFSSSFFFHHLLSLPHPIIRRIINSIVHLQWVIIEHIMTWQQLQCWGWGTTIMNEKLFIFASMAMIVNCFFFPHHSSCHCSSSMMRWKLFFPFKLRPQWCNESCSFFHSSDSLSTMIVVRMRMIVEVITPSSPLLNSHH